MVFAVGNKSYKDVLSVVKTAIGNNGCKDKTNQKHKGGKGSYNNGKGRGGCQTNTIGDYTKLTSNTSEDNGSKP